MDYDASLSSGNPRNINPESMAEVDGGGMQVRFRDCGPKVELVSRRTTFETPKRISCQVNRESVARGGRRTVDRTRSAQLVTVSLRGDGADQFENVPHRDRLPNRFEIDTRQVRFSSKRFPTMIPFCRTENRGTEKRNPYASSEDQRTVQSV